MGGLNVRSSASKIHQGHHTREVGGKEVYGECEEETPEKMAREKYAGRNDSSGSDSDVSSKDETNTDKYYDSASNWKHGCWLKAKSLE